MRYIILYVLYSSLAACSHFGFNDGRTKSGEVKSAEAISASVLPIQKPAPQVSEFQQTPFPISAIAVKSTPVSYQRPAPSKQATHYSDQTTNSSNQTANSSQKPASPSDRLNTSSEQNAPFIFSNTVAQVDIDEIALATDKLKQTIHLPRVAPSTIEPTYSLPTMLTLPQDYHAEVKPALIELRPIFNINALIANEVIGTSKNTPKITFTPPHKDYSEYGFITPTEGLEHQVNKELKLLRDDTETSAINHNLLDRLTQHFQLNLSLNNKRIQSQLRWFTRNPDYLDRTFKRSSRYLYYVVEEVRKRHLPMELALLPFIESAYDPFAYSHGRASGLWQFIPGTGKIYGLHQNWWYDGRRDVPASTKAALDYLSYLNTRFKGNWLHALAAYNSGSGRVSSAIKRNKKLGKSTDFWSLRLPRETKAYVPKLLALAKIVNHPESYGIALPAIEDSPYFSIVKTLSQIDLAQAASLADVEIQEIYKLNPGFNQWASAPLGPHRLLVPIEKASNFTEKLKTLPPEKRLNWNRYSVKRGDSLILIAKRFNTTPKLIKQINRLKSNLIRVRQKLLIPVASKGKNYYDLSLHNRIKNKQKKYGSRNNSQKILYIVKSGDTMWDLSRAYKVGVRSLAKWNGIAPTDPIKPGQKLVIWSNINTSVAQSAPSPIFKKREMIKKIGYRVKRGDSLAKIAGKFHVKIKDLIVWNKLNHKKYLQPGQKLTIFVDLTNS